MKLHFFQNPRGVIAVSNITDGHNLVDHGTGQYKTYYKYFGMQCCKSYWGPVGINATSFDEVLAKYKQHEVSDLSMLVTTGCTRNDIIEKIKATAQHLGIKIDE